MIIQLIIYVHHHDGSIVLFFLSLILSLQCSTVRSTPTRHLSASCYQCHFRVEDALIRFVLLLYSAIRSSRCHRRIFDYRPDLSAFVRSVQ